MSLQSQTRYELPAAINQVTDTRGENVFVYKYNNDNGTNGDQSDCLLPTNHRFLRLAHEKAATLAPKLTFTCAFIGYHSSAQKWCLFKSHSDMVNFDSDCNSSLGTTTLDHDDAQQLFEMFDRLTTTLEEIQFVLRKFPFIFGVLSQRPVNSQVDIVTSVDMNHDLQLLDLTQQDNKPAKKRQRTMSDVLRSSTNTEKPAKRQKIQSQVDDARYASTSTRNASENNNRSREKVQQQDENEEFITTLDLYLDLDRLTELDYEAYVAERNSANGLTVDKEHWKMVARKAKAKLSTVCAAALCVSKLADPNNFTPPNVQYFPLFPHVGQKHGFAIQLYDYQRRLVNWMLLRERQSLQFTYCSNDSDQKSTYMASYVYPHTCWSTEKEFKNILQTHRDPIVSRLVRFCQKIENETLTGDQVELLRAYLENNENDPSYSYGLMNNAAFADNANQDAQTAENTDSQKLHCVKSAIRSTVDAKPLLETIRANHQWIWQRKAATFFDNPKRFRCAISCGKTGCGKTTMKIFLMCCMKRWEDGAGVAAREKRKSHLTEFENSLPFTRRPLQTQVEELAAIRERRYYANCTLIVCPQQVVLQWYQELLKTYGCGREKPRPKSGPDRSILNGGVHGEILDRYDNVLLRVKVIRDMNAMRRTSIGIIMEHTDVLIVHQNFFASPLYQSRKKWKVTKELQEYLLKKDSSQSSSGLSAGAGDLFDQYFWIEDAIQYERTTIKQAEQLLQKQMLDDNVPNWNYCAVPQPGFAFGDHLLHALHFRRVIIDEAHQLSQRAAKLHRAIGHLAADFTWCLTATADFARAQNFYRSQNHREGGYAKMLGIHDEQTRKNLANHQNYRSAFVQMCTATSSAEQLPPLQMHCVKVQMTPMEQAIYLSLRVSANTAKERLMYCCHHMLHDEEWKSVHLGNALVSQQEQSSDFEQLLASNQLISTEQVAAQLQSGRMAEIETLSSQLENKLEYFIALFKSVHIGDIKDSDKNLLKKPTQENEEIVDHNLCSKAQLEEWWHSLASGCALDTDSETCQNWRKVQTKWSNWLLDNDTVQLLRRRDQLIAECRFFKQTIELLQQPDKEIECPICLDAESTQKLISVTVCGHMLCPLCAQQAYKRGDARCAMCKKPLRIPRDIRHIDRSTNNSKDKNDTDSDCDNGTRQKEPDELCAKYGSKISVLVKLIRDVLARADCTKVVVYAQFQHLLQLIASVLREQNQPFVIGCGTTQQVESSITKFRNNDSVRIILLSSERNISGVHLVEANHIIAVHPTICAPGDHKTDREYAILWQAIGRIRRLMQQNTCHVWQLVTQNTIEEQLYADQLELARQKNGHDQNILWHASDSVAEAQTQLLTQQEKYKRDTLEKAKWALLRL